MKLKQTCLAPYVRRLLALLVLPFAVSARSALAEDPPPEILVDGIDVVSNVRVRPGTYQISDRAGNGVLRVCKSGVTVDLTGVTLVGNAEGVEPDAFEGVGVSVAGVRDVTVKGGTIRGFRIAVRAENAPGLTVSKVDVSGTRRMHLRSTPESEDPIDWLWPHENDSLQWERKYGAGISLSSCAKARVVGCVGHGGQNGLLLSRCDGAAVYENDFSFSSGWGVALWRTSEAVIEGNRCDWCVRGYSHGKYARGQDSAGFLVFEQCSKNLFRGNSATHSGDGFFLYAGNETLKSTGLGGCNDNQVVSNDFSHAVANGIEATFSKGNRFVHNRLDDCDHGVWAGYSYDTTIQSNSMVGCANGVSIEHGHENRILDNDLEDCRTGIHLWWDDDKDLLASPYARKHETASARNVISRNRVRGSETALHLVRDETSTVSENSIEDCGVGVLLEAGTRNVEVRGNTITLRPSGKHVVNRTEEKLDADSNKLAGAEPVVEGPVKARRDIFAPRGPVGPEGTPPGLLAGSSKAFLASDALRGRKYILVGEWGPMDPREAMVFPATQTASGEARVHVLGAGLPFVVTRLTEGLVAEPKEGTAPATLHIRPAPGAKLAASTDFEVAIQLGSKERVARGTLFLVRWTVKFLLWTKNARSDPENWRDLLAADPLDTITTDALDFSWPGAPTAKVPADYFATVAEATLELTRKRYRLRVTSDDGVRVLMDDKVVFEDWTWHGPKEDTVDLTLEPGPHRFRVEHFELDGYATLKLSLEPVGNR